jgi:hypothetical protein
VEAGLFELIPGKKTCKLYRPSAGCTQGVPAPEASRYLRGENKAGIRIFDLISDKV